MAFYDQGGGFLLFLLLRAHGGKRKPVSVAEKVADKETQGLRGPEARVGLNLAWGSTCRAGGCLVIGGWINFGDRA